MDNDNIYLDKCSCITCKKVYPRKGIHTHYSINHIKGNKKKHRERSKKASIKGGEASKLKSEKKIFTYNQDPKKCQECKSIMDYSIRENKFCSSSCSTKYNNRNRKHGFMTDEVKRKISIGVSHYARHVAIGRSTKLHYRSCQHCSRTYVYHKENNTFPSNCSVYCLKETRSLRGRQNPGLGTKRSKDEISLFEYLSEHFNNIDHSYIVSNGWDTDIALLDYKIAIFWNGPWHYREMNIGNHSLKQVQNRDTIKKNLFTKLGWEVIIYEDRFFTPETAYLDILHRIT